MIRSLVGYNHVAGPAGNRLVPDLATTVPEPSAGGNTYTFHLKPGVKFGQFSGTTAYAHVAVS